MRNNILPNRHECEWTEANLPKGIKLNLRHEGRSIGPKQG